MNNCAAGTGSSFFAGDGVANFNGQFPIGFFAGQGEAQFNGAGQIQVYSFNVMIPETLNLFSYLLIFKIHQIIGTLSLPFRERSI